MTDTTWVISVDDHLVQPPDLWEKRLPARYRDRGPRVIEGAGGSPADVVARFAGKDGAADAAAAYTAVSATATPGDAWAYDGDVFPTTGASTAAGVPPEEYSPFPFSYQALPPEFVDPTARTKAMDQDGVIASLCFPMSEFPRFCGQSFLEAKDKALALLCVQAFNDFVLDEWCAAAPERFIPLVILPLWDPDLAAAEIHRTVARGARAIAFSEDPYKLGLPSIHDPAGHWDPVFRAAAETATPLCTHIGSGSWVPPVPPDAPLTVALADLGMIAISTATSWLLSDVFLRFPDLKLVLSEGGIGWVPYALSRVDYVWERHGLWTKTQHKEPPSRLFRSNVYGCFIDDPVGARAVREIGIDNCMLESDYPHSDSSWPNTLTMAKERLGYLDADEFAKVAQGNARRIFRFEATR